jgi:colicin import membrane protein
MVGTLYQRTIFWRPALCSLLLHALVISAMTMNWAGQREASPVARVQPRYVEARLVDASDLKPKKKPRKAREPTRKVVAKPNPTARQTTKPAAKTLAKKPAKKVASKPRAEPIPVPVIDTGPSAEEQRALAQQELALALDVEDSLLEQASDEDVAQSYVALISQVIQNNWSRPPSARNGMEAELVIQLIPTGEVVSVTVARSSGLLAFDRSAVNAVQKAERFPELQKLPPRIFEKSFRQFRLIFKPEDLRY